MKKKLTHLHSLLLLPLAACSSLLSMENQLSLSDNNKHPLEETIMVTPSTKTRGLGILRSTCDFIWDEEENLYSDLVCKKFDPNNSSYHRKLDTAIEIYVDKNNSQRITAIFDLCRKEYPKQIKIGDIAARKSHEFLVQENLAKQISFAKAIETKDKQFIEKQNELLDELQEYIEAQITKIKKFYDAHIAERIALVEKEGEDIRRIKRALVQLHHLNKTFVLPTDGYCTDDEKDADNVKNSYNDRYLLKKINIDYPMSQTKIKSDNLLKILYELNQKIQEIDLLNNSHFIKY